MTIPVSAVSAAASAAGSDSLLAALSPSWSILASAALAKSGTGTKLRRNVFGSDLINATARSARRPGI